jgi:thioredoxin-related protein
MTLARRLAVLAAALAMLLMPAGDRLEAARDIAAPATAERMELLVLEVRGCNICQLVRSELQPAYQRTPRARDVPMRFMDVTAIDERSIGLKAPIDTLPTIVLMRNGREVDRISGYLAPELFFNVLTHLMQQAEQ